MRLIILWVALALAGCGKSSKIPDTPQPRPPQLVATVSLPSATALEKLRDHVAAVRGVAAMAVDSHVVMIAAARGVAATNLDGLDPSAPLHAMWFDDGKLSGLAIVGRVRDEDALASGAKPAEVVIHDGWAVIGGHDIVEIAAPYALSTLVAQKPATPAATVYMDTLFARYGDKVAGWRSAALARSRRSPMALEITARILDGMIETLRESDELQVSVDVERGLGSLDLAVVPHAGSNLAAFVAAQQPSALPLVARLPESPGAIVAGGRFTFGPFRGRVMQAMAPTLGPELIANLNAIASGLTSELAIAADLTPEGLVTTQLLGIADGPAADAAAKTFELLAARPATTTTHKMLAETAHDGVTLHTLETTRPDEPRTRANRLFPAGTQQTAIATFDQTLVTAHAPTSSSVPGSGAGAAAARAIDAARGNAPRFTPSPDFATVIAAAKARSDSVVAWVDVGALRGHAEGAPRASAAMLFALGFADHAAHLRIAMPASTLKALGER